MANNMHTLRHIRFILNYYLVYSKHRLYVYNVW